MNFITSLVPKVLPAPDSPEIHTAYFLLLSNNCQKVLAANDQMCGFISSSLPPLIANF
jgi:hypothetical protein